MKIQKKISGVNYDVKMIFKADFHHTISTVVTTTLLILPLRFQLILLSTVFIWPTATTWPRTCSSTDNKISRAQFGTTPISTTVCSEILTLNAQEDLFYPPSPPPPTFPTVADKVKVKTNYSKHTCFYNIKTETIRF